MATLVITLDADHQKLIVKDHLGKEDPRKSAVINHQNPIQDLVAAGKAKDIVAVQTATIVWSKSSPGCVSISILGNTYTVCS